MILPRALLIGLLLTVTGAARADDVPNLNVEQVCDGIAQQGGVTFRDPAIAQEKKNCLDSELAVRNELVKQWRKFDRADKTSCVNESQMGGEFELYRASYLPGNGARRESHARGSAARSVRWHNPAQGRWR